MSYSTTNGPQLLLAPKVSVERGTNVSAGIQVYSYNSADSLATVQGSGYFTNGSDLGMKVGDAVLVSVAGVLKTPIQYVSAVNATTGAVTVAASTT